MREVGGSGALRKGDILFLEDMDVGFSSALIWYFCNTYRQTPGHTYLFTPTCKDSVYACRPHKYAHTYINAHAYLCTHTYVIL